jgi:DDE domain
MKPPPGVPWDAGGGAKAEALTLSHLETGFRDAEAIDFAGTIFGSVASLELPDRSGTSAGMRRRRHAAQVRSDQPFKGRQFTVEVILWAVRWYLMFPISYRDLALMLLDRGVSVDHTTIFRWIQAYAPELEKRVRPHLRTSNGSWRVDETYVKVKGRWTYLYRAVDSRG